MDENLKALWEQLSPHYEIGTFPEFQKMLSDPTNRKAFYEQVSPSVDFGVKDYDEFSQTFVKKKVTSKPSVDLSVAFPPQSTPSSSILQNAPTAAKGFDWDTGEIKLSAFEKNAENIYKLTVTNQANTPSQEETQPLDVPITDVTIGDVAMAGVESVNQGFYKQAVGGALKGVGELMLQGVKLIEPDAKPEDMWLWQAGNAIQKQFSEGGIAEPTSSPELLESDAGQIGAGLGQMMAMMLTFGASTEAAVASKIPKAATVLKEAGKQFFNRPAIMGTMQMLDEEASNVRQQKEWVESMPREEWVNLNVEMGEDEKLAGKKYDLLKNSDAEDLIAEMLPTVLAAGSTEGIPVAGWFKRLNKVTNGSFTKAFLQKSKDVTIGTFEGAAQEALQEWMSNATAKEVYDFTLKSTEGLEQAAKVGGGVQLILEVLGAAIGVKNRNSSGPDKEILDKAQEELAKKEETLAMNLENAITEEVSIADVQAELTRKVESGEVTQEAADEQLVEIEAKKAAISKTPEEHKMTPDVVDAVTEKTKVDEQIARKKEEIKAIDPAFAQQAKDEIADLETQSAELSLKVAEAAGVKPDEKAVKALEPKDGETKKPAKQDDTALPRFRNMVVDPATMEMYPEGKPKERRPVSGKTAKEFADSRIDEFATLPDTDLSGVSEQDVARKVLDEGSPAQVGQLWLVEPNSTQGEIFTKETAIEEAVTNSTFAERALEGIPDLSSSYLPKAGERAQVQDLNELAEELSEQTGMDITEADVADYIRSNPSKTKPKKPKTNPVKRAAAQKFKEMTGVAPTPEYVGRLAERAEKLKPELAETQAYDQATGAEVPPPGTESAVVTGQGGGKLRGFYERSLPKAAGQTPGKALGAKIGAANPQLYQQMTLSGETGEILAEIDADGFDQVAFRALTEQEGEGTKKTMARRVISLIATLDALAVANKEGNMTAVDQLSSLANALEKLIGQGGTEAGQTAAIIAIYSMTPEGRMAEQIRKVSKKREILRGQKNESGKPIGDVVDAITSEVAVEMGITKEEAEKVLDSIYGKRKAISSAKDTIAKGKKEVDEAKAAIRRILLGQANVGLPVAQYAKVGKQLVLMFSGYAKIYKGNIQKIRTSFRKSAKEIGLNEKAAYEYLEKNHPEIIGPVQDFHDKMLNAVVGFYNGNLETDLQTALEQIGMSAQEATDVASEFGRTWGVELARKQKTRLGQIIRKHEPSKKKARAIEDGLLEAVVLGGLNDDAIRTAIEEKYGIKTFTNEQINDLNQMVAEMKDLPGQGLKRKALTEINDYIASIKGSTAIDLIHELWFAAVLSDIKTYGSILIGNEMNFYNHWLNYGLFTKGGIHAMSESIKRLGNIGELATGEYKGGIWFGMSELANFVWNGTGSRDMKKISQTRLLEQYSKRHYTNKMLNFMNKAFFGAAKMPGRLINASDAFRFYSALDFTLDRMAYQGALAEGLTGNAARERAREMVAGTKESRQTLMERARTELSDYAVAHGSTLEGMFTNTDVLYRARELAEEQVDAARPGAIETAIKEAEKVSLQNIPTGTMGMVAQVLGTHFPGLWAKADTLPLLEFSETDGIWDQRIKKGYNALLKGTSTATRAWAAVFFAFMKTAGNVINMTSDFVPGFGVAHKLVFDNIAALAPGIERSVTNREELGVFLARQTEGAILVAAIALYFMPDEEEDEDPRTWKLTGTGNPLPEKRSDEYAKGWRPYTMHLFGKTWYYRDSPIGGILAILASMADAQRYSKDDEEPIPISDAMMAATSAYFTNASYLQSVSGLSDGLQESNASKVGLALVNPVTGFLNPGALRMADRIISPELRDSKTYENRFIGGLLSKTAIASNYLLDLKYNSLGEPVDPYKHKSVFSQVTGMDKYVSTDEPYNKFYDVLAQKGMTMPQIGYTSKALGTAMDYQELRDFTLMIGRYRRMRVAGNLDKLMAMTPQQFDAKIRSLDDEGRLIAGLLIVQERDGKREWTPERIDGMFTDYEELIDRAKDMAKDLKAEIPEDDANEIPKELEF